MSQNLIHVGLIGLSRQNVSLALALKAHAQSPSAQNRFHITGQDLNPASIQAAQKRGALDEAASNTRQVAKTSDILLVDLPPALQAEVYAYFAPSLKAGAVLLDLATDKSASLAYFQPHLPRDGQGRLTAYWVGIQPMVATARLFDYAADLNWADPADFAGSELLVCAEADCPPEALRLATDFAALVGMKAFFLSPEEYSALSNFTERLPILLGLLVWATLQASDGARDLERTLNPNFARLLSPLHSLETADMLVLWGDSAEAMRRRLDELIALLEAWRQALDTSSPHSLSPQVRDLMGSFAAWQTRRAKQDWESAPPVPDISLRDVLGTWFGLGRKQRTK
jgi:prephenate dehydrogenase